LEGYLPSAKSAEAARIAATNHSGMVYTFIHRQGPWSSAEADKRLNLRLKEGFAYDKKYAKFC
jgi:hypothetical protein